MPDQSNRAYAVDALHRRGIQGEGQGVAIVMDADLNTADIEAWATQTGTGDVTLTQRRVGVESQAERTAFGGGVEGSMDVEQVFGVAPRAHVFYYEASLDNFADALNQILKDGDANIVSFSAGGCDLLQLNPDGRVGRDYEQRVLETAATAGVNVFVSSGDSGAFTCSAFVPGDFRVAASWPADSPYVTAVGGTFLERAPDGTYVGEAAWGQPLDNSGSGGGLNPVDPRPTWQRGLGVLNSESNGERQVPDVAAAADPVSGWYVVHHGRADAVGGTSASSPFWAGLAALFQQSAQQAHVGPLGFLPPTLYALAATSRPGTLFHDVGRGDNLHFVATPGWDYTTGLGTPIASALDDAIVAYLRSQR
jgi:kumamolisin